MDVRPTLDPNPLPRVLYIAGYGRSGSTLLDLLLGNHPRVFGAGEVSRLFWDVGEGRPCSCGLEYRACPVWSQVLARAVPGLSNREFLELRTRQLSAQMRLRPEAMEEYREIWRRVFHALSVVTGCEVIVDSSKSARRPRHRRVLLHRLCGFHVKSIHLVRDPRGVMWSASRGSNTRIEQGLPPRKFEELRALLHWTYTNWFVERQDRRLGGKSMSLRYEDLVGNPTSEIQRICRLIAVDPAPLLTRLQEGQDFDPGHGVGGNRFRRKGPVELRTDDEWERKLPTRHRISALASWPVARRFGYPALPGSASREAPSIGDE